MRITATIITLNEERNIARSIESLRCCDQIVVLEDSWHGYANQKNLAAEHAGNDWVLSLDADEALSEALEGEIWNLKKRGPAYDAYTVPRMAQYMGRWILHGGWYPDRKVRLYNRQKGTWQGEFVHETVKVAGRVGHLESNLLHFTCESLSEHLRTMDRYTTLAAEELVSRKTKIGLSNLILDPAWTFLRSYVLQRGFLDGLEGLTIAHMAAIYTFLKYAKARNMSSE